MTTVQPVESEQSISVSDILNKNVRKHGLTFVSSLVSVIRLSRMYGFEHTMVAQGANQFIQSVNVFAGTEGYAALEARSEFLFLNEVRIKSVTGGNEAFEFLRKTLTTRGIGKVLFKAGVTLAQIQGLCQAVQACRESDKEPFKKVLEQLVSKGIDLITVEPPLEVKITSSVADCKNRSVEAYYKTMTVFREVMAACKINGKFPFRNSKRAMHSMIDTAQEDDTILLSLCAVRKPEEYAVTHATNTAILAVVLGNRLGLPRKVLSDLGLSALFADLGMGEVDSLITSKPGPLTDREWEAVHRHPMSAVKTFLQSSRMVDVVVRCIQTALEHHRGPDGKGYPKLPDGVKNTLFSDIIAICDSYDALTSPRPFRQKPLSPPEALGVMREKVGTKYDPLLFKVFVNTLGIYPVGTLVLLDTREIGVVIRGKEDPKMAPRPQVRLFCNSAGKTCDQMVDLGDMNAEGLFVRSVQRVVLPEELKIELRQHLSLL